MPMVRLSQRFVRINISLNGTQYIDGVLAILTLGRRIYWLRRSM
jgi:hypothetical protein